MKGRTGVILLLCILFSTVNSDCEPGKDVKQGFTIEEAALGQIPVEYFSGKWISDTEIEYFDKETKNIVLYNVLKNVTKVILKADILEKYKTRKYAFSGDRKFVLITYDEKDVRRHSKSSRYAIYSIADGKFYNVSNGERIQIAEWAPTKNTLVYIKNNNIYVIPRIDQIMKVFQITKNGIPELVFNGIGDWVYEEEILGSAKAFWFSPDGNQLLFATFKDDKVKKGLMFEYGEGRDEKFQYQKLVEFPYPKAGTPNPTHELRHVYLNSTGNETLITQTMPGREILHSVSWASDKDFVFLQTNRVQNESKTFLCNLKSCRMIYQDNNKVGWANTRMPVFNKKMTKTLRIEGIPLNKKDSTDRFRHLKLYEGKNFIPLTRGHLEVLSILQWDEANRTIYYSATEEMKATPTQIYSVTEAQNIFPYCLSCDITSPEGRKCKAASASFSKNSNYVIIQCLGPDPSVVYLFKNEKPLRKPLRILEDNAKLRKFLEKKLMPTVMFKKLEIADHFSADVRLFLPPNMDTSGNTKYPLVIYVYGGPDSKNINEMFKIDWGYYLTTNKSIIYGLIDGRNTNRKGERMLFAGYQNLGTLEMVDQSNVTRYLQNNFRYIDSNRTGIWGWSYGGYATTKILETDFRNIYKCGIAVAPVADWMYYDSMYTEKFMKTPQENPVGYETASTLKGLPYLRNKKYFLIHGNADDNVHYQNAMLIAKKLEQNNVPFELMSYPDEDHSLKGVRKHLYYTMSRFWDRCFFKK